MDSFTLDRYEMRVIYNALLALEKSDCLTDAEYELLDELELALYY